MTELGLSRSELARQLGYSNVPKGLRKIDSIIAGNLDGLERQITALAAALLVENSVVSCAVEETQREAEEARRKRAETEDQAWRASFKPHVIVLTERTVPSQITICGMVRGERFRWIDLDTSKPRATYIQQAMHELENRLTTLKTKILPFFGPATGFVVNLTPDLGIRYSLMGEAEEILPKAYRMGHTLIRIGGRPISPAALAALFERL